MVRKGNGGWRMCQDYTDLKKACPKDSFPLPRIDQLVDATAGHELLSFLDAYSGYNQIFMHPADSEHMTFITDRGLYCYNVMRGGNISKACQPNFHQTHRQHHGGVCRRYASQELNGRGAFNKPGPHVRYTKRLPNETKPNEVYLRCVFGQRGIEANPEKIKAIIDMERPKTQKDIQSHR
ncbi:unnamed protein product [Prunus armeniaca]